MCFHCIVQIARKNFILWNSGICRVLSCLKDLVFEWRPCHEEIQICYLCRVWQKSKCSRRPHHEGLIGMIDKAQDMLLCGFAQGKLNPETGWYGTFKCCWHASQKVHNVFTQTVPFSFTLFLEVVLYIFVHCPFLCIRVPGTTWTDPSISPWQLWLLEAMLWHLHQILPTIITSRTWRRWEVLVWLKSIQKWYRYNFWCSCHHGSDQCYIPFSGHCNSVQPLSGRNKSGCVCEWPVCSVVNTGLGWC